MLTAEDVRNVVTQNIEPTEPADTILRVFRENNGKRFDKRFIAKLVAATNDDSLYASYNYGMTHIVFGGYDRNRGNTGGSLLVSHDVTNITVDADKLVEKNPAYYSARDERNAERREFLQNTELHHQIADAINNFRTATEKLREVLKTGNDGSRVTDCHEFEQLAGLIDERGQRVTYLL